MIDDFKFNCELVCNNYNLFADDDSYHEFRQSIINAPVFSYDKNKLPFEDIKLRNHELDIDIRLEFQFLLHSLLPKTTYADKKLFYLYKPGICRSYGYYIPSSKYFVVCEGSLVSNYIDTKYEGTNFGNAHARFIDKACEKYPNYYRVHKDAVCGSPTAAASYVLGRVSKYTNWKDVNGNVISDFYPDHFLKRT